jgi:hypothetical protein
MYFPIVDRIYEFIEKCKKEHSLHYWIWELTTGIAFGVTLALSLIPNVIHWHILVYVVILRLVWMIPVGIYEKRHGYKFSWLWNK